MEEKRQEDGAAEVDTERIAEGPEEASEAEERERLLKNLQEALEAAGAEGAADEASPSKGGRPGDEEGLEKLQAELEQAKHELAAARADLYNYRQRVERDRARNRKLIAEDKAAEFLPVLDNLDRALCVPEDGSAKDVLIGVRMVQRQFLSVLENSEVTAIPTAGCCFDPLLHDAVETEYVEDPSLDGMILGELLRGYRTPDRVLRAAQVRVGKLKNED